MSSTTRTPSRVLMTADTVGGVWTYALDLIRALESHAVQVTLATMGSALSPDQRQEVNRIGNLDLVESRYRLPWMEDPWNDVEAAGYWLLQLASRVAPDVVHLNEPVFGALRWPAPTVVVGHSCVLSWWQAVWNAAAPEEWDRYRREMTNGLKAADEVVAPSPWMLEELRRHYGISQGRVIQNGRDPSSFSPGTKGPFVFAAGRLWDSAKNLPILESAAAGLHWPVYVAGDTEPPLGQGSVTAEHLHLLGRLSSGALASWLRHAAIYAHPARYEPFGLAVLEAALAGCALVLSDVPTLRKLWDGAAIFVPPDEPSLLRLAIETLADEPGLRGTLAMRARRRALNLTPQRMASGYLAVYSDLFSRRDSYQEVRACAS
jgi:glycogen(starch) synthase